MFNRNVMDRRKMLAQRIMTRAGVASRPAAPGGGRLFRGGTGPNAAHLSFLAKDSTNPWAVGGLGAAHGREQGSAVMDPTAAIDAVQAGQGGMYGDAGNPPAVPSQPPLDAGGYAPAQSAPQPVTPPAPQPVAPTAPQPTSPGSGPGFEGPLPAPVSAGDPSAAMAHVIDAAPSIQPTGHLVPLGNGQYYDPATGSIIGGSTPTTGSTARGIGASGRYAL